MKKYDVGKLQYDLIPPGALRGLAQVLTYGAEKYGAYNWTTATEKDLTRYRSAALRHFEAYRAGEREDPESGLWHLDHAICNFVFLRELEGTMLK